MKKIEFKSKNAQKIYDDYLSRCTRMLRVLSEKDSSESLLEINSHIFEFIQNSGTEDELDSLLNILERLGPPEITLKDIIADKKIDQAVRTLNPRYLVSALILNIGRGVGYTILSILFLLLPVFLFLIVAKIIEPNNVGLYVGGGSFLFGHSTETQNRNEVLGDWFIPLMLVVSVVFYLMIIVVLKLIRKSKK